MTTPTQLLQKCKNCIKKEWKTAFLTAVILGLFVHMPMLVSDIPNHDGLDSMYFDQNMITSGRWFLTVACGFSSYYTLPWLIGLLAVLWLGVSAVMLTEFLEVKDTVTTVLISALLVTFPALASTFAYVFTMDGYMLALMLAIAAPLCVKKRKYGFLPGAFCLAFSLGTYQSYLPFAVILSIYGIVMLAMMQGTFREKVKKTGSYLAMGALGLVLYYGILKILLRMQGKELASYQGISGLSGSGAQSAEVTGSSASGLLQTVYAMYRDFFAFSLKGNVIVNNIFSLMGVILLLLAAAVLLVKLLIRNKWYKSIWCYVIPLLLAVGLPVASNLILAVSPGVTYHLLMRYQWVLFLILPAAFVSRYGSEKDVRSLWGVTAACVLLAGNFAVTDNIAYSNLQKRYEKTYAYCLRLLDRIEQTPGYYPGIPVAMIGVVGDEQYPVTDITQDVTSNMIGMNGDVLLYTGNNYEIFIRNYLGATLNILPTEVMSEIYYSDEYREMESFPGETGVKLVDGIIYVKTENIDRTEGK